MQRWFRFCAGIALISFIGTGIHLPASAAEDEDANVDVTEAMPPPGKHQLRPTPAQIAEYRIELLNKRLLQQAETLKQLSTLTEEQDKKIEAQAKEIEALSGKAEASNAALAALDGRIVELTEALSKLKARSVSTAKPPSAPTAAPETSEHSEGPVLKAEPVTPTTPVEAGAVDGEIYIVKRGDNLTNIAKQHGTTVSELLKLNKIEDERKLQIGQKLILPKQ